MLSPRVILPAVLLLPSSSAACHRLTVVEDLEDPVLRVVVRPPALPPVPEHPPPPPPPLPKVELRGEVVVLLEPITFEGSLVELNESSAEVVAELAAVLIARTDLLVLSIEVHTGPEGSARANRRMSRLRAEAIREHLVVAGVGTDRLRVQGWGESRPLPVSGQDDPGGAPRPVARVEVLVVERAPAGHAAPIAETEEAP